MWLTDGFESLLGKVEGSSEHIRESHAAPIHSTNMQGGGAFMCRSYSYVKGTFVSGSYSHVEGSHVEGTFICESYSCVKGIFTSGSYSHVEWALTCRSY